MSLRFMGDKITKHEADLDDYVKSIPPSHHSPPSHKIYNIWKGTDGKYRIEWEDNTDG